MNRKIINIAGLIGIWLWLIPICSDSLMLNAQLTVDRERNFTGAGLYGFMNGGADLFLEYGVMSLITRDVTYKGEKFTVDIYEMPTPADAYGIYSVHVFKCQRADTLECIDCLSPYQLQAVVGNKYVSVVFPSGALAAQVLADELLLQYVPEKTTEGQKPIVPELIGKERPFSGKVKFLRGPISVSSASRYLTNLLKDAKYDGVWFKEDKKNDGFEAMILVSDAKNLETLKQAVAEENQIQMGKDFLYIKGKEPEEEEVDYGPFGF